MNEQQAKPPALHLVSCLYVITGLMLIYLTLLKFILRPTYSYPHPLGFTFNVKPYVHLCYWEMLLSITCLAVSYWERFLVVKAVAGFIGIVTAIVNLGMIFQEPPRAIIGNRSPHYREMVEFAARIDIDVSYFPMLMGVVLIALIMLLRLFDYRPTTFRLTLLDLMLITIAVAIMLSTRGIVMNAYGLA
jgi:hypothetical protein